MRDIETIYVDDDILVINKPSGMLSIPDGYKPDMPHLRSLLEPKFGRLWMVHRLDKESSGVMVLARNAQAHRLLNQQFKDRLVNKIYHALVSPHPEWQSQNVNFPLAINTGRKHLTRVDFINGKLLSPYLKSLNLLLGLVYWNVTLKQGIATKSALIYII